MPCVWRRSRPAARETDLKQNGTAPFGGGIPPGKILNHEREGIWTLNKYKRLISNTLIFAIGTFSSKVLSFLLTPLLSYALTPAEFSITNMIVDMGNLLLPLATLGIINAIIRFGLDNSVKKSDVFTTGFFTILFGFCC